MTVGRMCQNLVLGDIAVFPPFVQTGLPEHFGKLHLWCSILTRQFTHLLSSFFRRVILSNFGTFEREIVWILEAMAKIVGKVTRLSKNPNKSHYYQNYRSRPWPLDLQYQK